MGLEHDNETVPEPELANLPESEEVTLKVEDVGYGCCCLGFLVWLAAIIVLGVAKNKDEWIIWSGLPFCPEKSGVVGVDTVSFPQCGAAPAVESSEPFNDFWPFFPAENAFGGAFSPWYGEEQKGDQDLRTTCFKLVTRPDRSLLPLEAYMLDQDSVAANLLLKDESALQRLASYWRKETLDDYDAFLLAVHAFWYSVVGVEIQNDVGLIRFQARQVQRLFELVGDFASELDFFQTSNWDWELTALNAKGALEINNATLWKLYFGEVDPAQVSAVELLASFVAQPASRAWIEEKELLLANTTMDMAALFPSLASSCNVSPETTFQVALFGNLTGIEEVQDVVISESFICQAQVASQGISYFTEIIPFFELCQDEQNLKSCRGNFEKKRLPKDLMAPGYAPCHAAVLKGFAQGASESLVNTTRCAAVDLIGIILEMPRLGSRFPYLPSSLSTLTVVNTTTDPNEEYRIPSNYMVHLTKCAAAGLSYERDFDSPCHQTRLANPQDQWTIPEAISDETFNGVCSLFQWKSLRHRDGGFIPDKSLLEPCNTFRDFLTLLDAFGGESDIGKSMRGWGALLRENKCSGRQDCLDKFGSGGQNKELAIFLAQGRETSEEELESEIVVRFFGNYSASTCSEASALQRDISRQKSILRQAFIYLGLAVLTLIAGVENGWPAILSAVFFVLSGMIIRRFVSEFDELASSSLQFIWNGQPIAVSSGSSVNLANIAEILAYVCAAFSLVVFIINLVTFCKKRCATTGVDEEDSDDVENNKVAPSTRPDL